MGVVHAVPCPNFPASTRTVIKTVLSMTSNADMVVRGVFRDEFGRMARLVQLNTGVDIRNEVTIVRNSGCLANTGIMTPSLHKNFTLVATNLTTGNGAIVANARRLSEKCRTPRGILGLLKTSIEEVGRGSKARGRRAERLTRGVKGPTNRSTRSYASQRSRRTSSQYGVQRNG